MSKTKKFAERLNQLCDELDMPESLQEREALLSKMLGVSKEIMKKCLRGYAIPERHILEAIAAELDVKPEWLLGEDVPRE